MSAQPQSYTGPIHVGPTPPANPGSGAVWLNTAEEPDGPQCKLTGTHVGGDERLRYTDGIIVMYCKFCNVRMMMDHMRGGVDATVLSEMSNQVLGGELKRDESFDNLVDNLEADLKRIAEVVKIARWVQKER